MKYTFQLWAGRHPIPGNPPTIFPGTVNPLDVLGLRDTADAAIPADADAVTLYITGLTVAALAVVKVCVKRGIQLTAMHYDRDSNRYYPQRVC